jgi:hypothetical protein
MATRIKPGYHRMPDGKVIKVLYAAPKPGAVFCEDLYGHKLDMPRNQLEKAKPLTAYRPSIVELFETASTRPLSKDQVARMEGNTQFSEELTWHHRLELFFLKLIEFDHLRIDTLGYYYYKKAAHNKEALGNTIAYKLAECFYYAFTVKSEQAEIVKARVLAWGKTPTEETRKKLFLTTPSQNPSELHVDRGCPITGATFVWGCDGKTIRPLKRRLDQEEEAEEKAKLREELTELRALKTAAPKQVERKKYLAELLETEYGWMRSYDITGLTPAVPFKKAYADPQTGEFPKTVVEIDVPTGQLVFANSLFKYLRDFDEDQEFATKNSVNHTRGRANTTRFHALENQAFYVPVGNNSPHVWQKKSKASSLRIGRASDEPEKGEWAYKDAIKGWHDRGYICTDLWAFHACDLSRLPEKIEVDHFIVKVPPGRYRLTNHYDHDGRRTGIFCEIEKIP